MESRLRSGKNINIINKYTRTKIYTRRAQNENEEQEYILPSTDQV